jgi:hypothetical protein
MRLNAFMAMIATGGCVVAVNSATVVGPHGMHHRGFLNRSAHSHANVQRLIGISLGPDDALEVASSDTPESPQTQKAGDGVIILNGPGSINGEADFDWPPPISSDEAPLTGLGDALAVSGKAASSVNATDLKTPPTTPPPPPPPPPEAPSSPGFGAAPTLVSGGSPPSPPDAGPPDAGPPVVNPPAPPPPIIIPIETPPDPPVLPPIADGPPELTTPLFTPDDPPPITPPLPGGVPEPATWTMMILGFGVIGAGRRRRRAGLRGVEGKLVQ